MYPPIIQNTLNILLTLCLFDFYEMYEALMSTFDGGNKREKLIFSA